MAAAGSRPAAAFFNFRRHARRILLARTVARSLGVPVDVCGESLGRPIAGSSVPGDRPRMSSTIRAKETRHLGRRGRWGDGSQGRGVGGGGASRSRPGSSRVTALVPHSISATRVCSIGSNPRCLHPKVDNNRINFVSIVNTVPYQFARANVPEPYTVVITTVKD